MNTAPDNAAQRLAAELRRLRQAAPDLTLEALGKQVGCGRTALSEAMNGHRVLTSGPVMRKLVRELDGDEELVIGLWRAARAEAEGHRPGPSRRAWRSAQVAAAVGIALVVVTFLVVGVWHPWQPGQVAGGHADLTSTDPATTNGALRCMRVTASRDVRVFTSETTEETWTTWPHDTRFVVDGISRNQKRYRTPLRNGRHGWVTSDPQYVAESGDCGAIG